MIYKSNFKISLSDANGEWVKISELNEMITKGILLINKEKMRQYQIDEKIILPLNTH